MAKDNWSHPQLESLDDVDKVWKLLLESARLQYPALQCKSLINF